MERRRPPNNEPFHMVWERLVDTAVTHTMARDALLGDEGNPLYEQHTEALKTVGDELVGYGFNPHVIDVVVMDRIGRIEAQAEMEDVSLMGDRPPL